ncbi:50S ribosomal protein L6 [Candidatus Sumerlaeota bacterium]|nr:50S ribosomal protein L6 [Candidatus Sumerlaeota bacterium]
MSRIGKIPINIPKGINVKISNNHIEVAGAKGKLELTCNDYVEVVKEGDQILVKRKDDSKKSRAFHGLYQRLLQNMVKGVSEGFTKELEIVGLGYKALKEGKRIVLNLGYSHPINFEPPEGIEIEVPNPNRIVVKGIDKQKVGQVAANIRALRPPEPYKSKGIRYVGEYIRRKVGKTGGKV